MKRKKILFVCTGNTCRSPMAEALLRSKIKRNKIKYIDVASAGLSVIKNAVMNPLTEEVLAENGLSMPKFKPRKLTEKRFESAYVVITMTAAQKAQLPQTDKVYAMGELTGEGDVKDPYGGGAAAYRQAFSALDIATEKIVRFITEGCRGRSKTEN